MIQEFSARAETCQIYQGASLFQHNGLQEVHLFQPERRELQQDGS